MPALDPSTASLVRATIVGSALATAAACGGSKEAIEVPLPVVASGDGLAPAATALGWTVELTSARAALHDLEMTVGGEAHEQGLLARAWDWLVPSAAAHPGHAANGDVTGALAGEFIVDWTRDGDPLGTAVLLEGDYHGANFYYRVAGAGDGLDPGDPLLGHTFQLVGAATKDATTIAFDALVDVDVDATLIGAPFVLDVAEGATATLALDLLLHDPVSDTTPFDAIDFAALDAADATPGDGAVAIRPGEDAHNLLRRAVQVHDFYTLDVR